MVPLKPCPLLLTRAVILRAENSSISLHPGPTRLSVCPAARDLFPKVPLIVTVCLLFCLPIPSTQLTLKFCHTSYPKFSSSAIQLGQPSPVEQFVKHSCLLLLPTPMPAIPGNLLQCYPFHPLARNGLLPPGAPLAPFLSQHICYVCVLVSSSCPLPQTGAHRAYLIPSSLTPSFLNVD